MSLSYTKGKQEANWVKRRKCQANSFKPVQSGNIPKLRVLKPGRYIDNLTIVGF